MNFSSIIYVSSIRWDYSWHRQQEMMSYMANSGYRILFVEPVYHKINKTGFFQLNKINDNIYILQIFGFPYERCLRITNFINSVFSQLVIKWAYKRLCMNNPLIWIDRIHGFNYKYFIKCNNSIYDLIDEITAFGRWNNKKMLESMEKYVLNNAKIVISSSRMLSERKKVKCKNRIIHFLPNGLDYYRFNNYKNNIKTNLDNISHPIIGFVGTISLRSIDFGLLNEIASKREDCSFVLLGPADKVIKELISEDNIYCLPPISMEDIPATIGMFDICMIPYNIESNSMDYVFPRKIFEYLAMGKPVISTSLQEIRLFEDVVSIVNNFSSFNCAIDNALKNDNNNEIEKRKKVAQKYDWDFLMGDLISLIKNEWHEEAI